MNIVYVSPYYRPEVASGANRRLDEICSRLETDFGPNFSLIVSKGCRPQWWSGKGKLFEVYYKFNHFTKFSAMRQIARILDSLPPSTVIYESIPIPFAELRRHTHFQTAYDFRYFYSFSKNFLYRALFTQYLKYEWRNCQYIVTCSEFSMDEIKRYVGLPRERVIKSFFGINEKIFDVPHLSMDRKEFDLIYVGHFDGHKNHAPLIDALAHMDKSLKVVFIGMENGLLPLLKARAAGYGLKNVIFTTIREEKKVWEFYTKSRVFVSPSLYEGFGMPTIEALALGLPVALSDIPVFHEVAGELAIYFKPRDPRDIAEKLINLLKNPTPPDASLVRRQLEPFVWKNIYRKFICDLKEKKSNS